MRLPLLKAMVSELMVSPMDAQFRGNTVAQALSLIIRQFADAGLETPSVDARRLVEAALKLGHGDIIRDPERRIGNDEARALAAMVQRRLAREPVSRIVGERAFYGRVFQVTGATLDPRPCSETLIEAVLEIVAEEGFRDRPIRIADVGTGTGCLILTLLAELPRARGIAIDVSAEALSVAARNGEALGLGDRVEFKQGSFLDPLHEPVDLLISNPPYIASHEIGGLDPEVRDFDPLLALDGGKSGLDAYRAIAGDLKRVVPSGWAVFEVGAGQALDVAAILRAVAQRPGFSEERPVVRTWRDLGGHERCVAIKTQYYP